jgi:hypothetical protein
MGVGDLPTLPQRANSQEDRAGTPKKEGSMSYQVCIINPRGATLRTGPSTNGGEINILPHGAVLDVERLVFLKPQAFNTNYIPSFMEALAKSLVVGDIWCQIKGFQMFKEKQVTGYVALRVASTTFGALAGSVDPHIIPMADKDARIAEIDEMIRWLTIRRMELSS